jgi:hypothetical protein
MLSPKFLVALVSVLLFTLGFLAQDAPFTFNGALEEYVDGPPCFPSRNFSRLLIPIFSVTADDATVNSGGSLKVNGFTVKVPKNLQVGFPASFVPFSQVVARKAALIGMEVNVSVRKHGRAALEPNSSTRSSAMLLPLELPRNGVLARSPSTSSCLNSTRASSRA